MLPTSYLKNLMSRLSDNGLTEGQENALAAMMMGENVFLTGDAGTGKSFVLGEFLKKIARKKHVIACAPTGIAALRLKNGSTIHRAFRVPFFIGVNMRLDKFLKVSRLIKRRTIANEACDAGRVMVNGNVVKASYNVKEGDVLEIQFGNKTVKAEILSVQETVKKDEAKEMFRYL